MSQLNIGKYVSHLFSAFMLVVSLSCLCRATTNPSAMILVCKLGYMPTLSSVCCFCWESDALFDMPRLDADQCLLLNQRTFLLKLSTTTGIPLSNNRRLHIFYFKYINIGFGRVERKWKEKQNQLSWKT